MNRCRSSNWRCPGAHATLIVTAIWAGAAEASAQPAPPAVLVAPAEMRDVSGTAEFVGRVKAIDKVDLRARVAGYLGPRLFKEGDLVKEGQTVFTLDPAPFEATLAQRKAEVASAAEGRSRSRRSAGAARTRADQDQNDPAIGTRPARSDAAEGAGRLEHRPRRRSRRPRSISPTRRSRARSTAASVRPRILPVILSARTAACSRPWSNRTRSRSSSMSASANCWQARRDTPPTSSSTAIVALCGSPTDRPTASQGKLDFIGVQADPNTNSIPLRAVFPNPKDVARRRDERARHPRSRQAGAGAGDPAIGDRRRIRPAPTSLSSMRKNKAVRRAGQGRDRSATAPRSSRTASPPATGSSCRARRGCARA